MQLMATTGQRLITRLLTFRLWRVFRSPPADNHLYTRLYHQPDPPRAQSAAVALSVLVGMFLLSGGVALLVALVPLLSPLVGAVWAYGIAGTVRRQIAPYIDLLAVTPNGALGSYVYTALGVMHRKARFNDLIGSQVVAVRWVGSGVISLVLLWWFILDPVSEISLGWFLVLFVISVPLVRLMFRVVHIYCVETGALAAMTAATFSLNAVAVQVGALLGYSILLAFSTLALVVITSTAFQVLSSASFVLAFVLTEWLVLAAMVGITEMVVNGLWATLVARLDADTDAQALFIYTPSIGR